MHYYFHFMPIDGYDKLVSFSQTDAYPLDNIFMCIGQFNEFL